MQFAATSRRRDVLVGGQTVPAALLNALAPELVDRVLGAVAPFTQSSANQGILAARDKNVFTPLQNVAAVHGPFDGGHCLLVSNFGLPRTAESLRPGWGYLACWR